MGEKMTKIQTPENTPRLFDLVKVKDEKIHQAFILLCEIP